MAVGELNHASGFHTVQQINGLFCGHAHLLVQKQVQNDRTYTAVQTLDEAGRLREMARIIGGDVTDTTLEAAREMRQKAESEG